MKSRSIFRRNPVGIVLILAIAGCASVNEMVARESSLIGPRWELVSIRQGERTLTPPPGEGSRYTIEFVSRADARLNLDCNTGTAGWSASVMRRVLRIGSIRTTKMACPDPTIAQAMLDGLPGGNTYSFSADERTLWVQSPGGLFTFRDDAPR